MYSYPVANMWVLEVNTACPRKIVCFEENESVFNVTDSDVKRLVAEGAQRRM